jgi:NodT family efflux transporter outer membrane factor (OMF) lipoprotein
MQRHVRRKPCWSIVGRDSAETAAIMCTLVLEQGCVVGPKYVPPSVQAPVEFKEKAPDGTQWKTVAPQDGALRDNWWEIFGEPELNALEDALNASNQSVAQSFQNFMAARAQVREARAGYMPTLTVSPSFTRSRTSPNALGILGQSSGMGTSAGQAAGATATSSANATNLTNNEFSLPFDVSWEPDLWGKVRNSVREYANAVQVSAADLANERLTEQANLAVYYFQLRGQDSLEDLYRQTVEADRKSLELTLTLRDTGIDNDQSVAQATLTLDNDLAAATNLKIARAQYEHAIAALIGRPASAFALPATTSVSTSVPAIPVGLPSDLLERRPDIAAAERTMSQANALIGVETAAFYPTLTLSAEGGFQSTTAAQWLTWPSRFFSLGPSVAETLFDGGLRRATVAQYTAQYNADVAAYQQTVLTAFQQTEDYLAALRLLQTQVDQQQVAVSAAQHYLEIAVTRYRTGVDTYLNVLAAQSSLLIDQQTTVNLHVQQLTDSVQLIEALGGGWNRAALPSAPAVASKTELR